MIIDILFFIIIVFAIIKGYSKGLISVIFSFIGTILGIVLAFKFSSFVASWLQKATNIPAYWLPFISFSLIIIGVFILVRVASKTLEKSADLVMLTWLNKLLGFIFFASIFISLLSCFIFFFDKMTLLKAETLADSKTYPFIQPWAPYIIEGFGKVIPFVKESLHQLEQFFSNSSKLIH